MERTQGLWIRGIETGEHARLLGGGLDDNGQPPLRRIAEGPANPCRHCLAAEKASVLDLTAIRRDGCATRLTRLLNTALLSH